VIDSAENFLRSFVLPLVGGGPLHVGRPKDARFVTQLRDLAFLGGDATLEVELARQKRAAAFWLSHVSTPFCESSLALVVGAHNLLFLSHPDRQRWSVTEARCARMVGFTARLLRLSPPHSEEETVARHTLLAHLGGLVRTDTELEYWAARHFFSGQEPPRRLKRWPRLRRVRERRQVVTWLETAPLSDHQLQLLQALLSASPLTQLLTPQRPTPAFDWNAVGDYLRWPRLCRLVCHHYLELGLEQVGPPLAQAFWELTTQPTPRRAELLRTIVGLIFYLYASQLLTTSVDLVTLPQPPALSRHLLVVMTAGALCGLVPRSEQLALPEVESQLRSLITTCRKNYDLSPLTNQLKQALAA
jgi:hypothetical protein